MKLIKVVYTLTNQSDTQAIMSTTQYKTFGPFDYNKGRKIWYDFINDDNYWNNASFKIDDCDGQFFIHLQCDIHNHIANEKIINDVSTRTLTDKEIEEVDDDFEEYFEEYNDTSDEKMNSFVQQFTHHEQQQDINRKKMYLRDNIQLVYNLGRQGYSHVDNLAGRVQMFLRDFIEILSIVKYIPPIPQVQQKIEYNIVEYILRTQNIPTDTYYLDELLPKIEKQVLVCEHLQGLFAIDFIIDTDALDLLCNSIEHVLHQHVYHNTSKLVKSQQPLTPTTLENTVKVTNDVYNQLLKKGGSKNKQQIDRVVGIAKKLPIPSTFEQLFDVISRGDELEKMTDREIYDDVVNSIEYYMKESAKTGSL